MKIKRQLTLHFDTEVAAAIETEAKRRGLNLSRAANDALHDLHNGKIHGRAVLIP